MKEKVKAFWISNWSLSEKSLLLADVLLFGILIGWLTSPLKNGFHFFSHNTCGNNNAYLRKKARMEAKKTEENEMEDEEK